MQSEINSRLFTVSLVLLSSSIHHSTESIPICRSRLEYWSKIHLSCTPCTKCAPEFTKSPCAIHKDAICGPLSIQLPILINNHNKKSTDDFNQQKNPQKKLLQISNLEISQDAFKQSNNSQTYEQNDEQFHSPDFPISLDNSNEKREINYMNKENYFNNNINDSNNNNNNINNNNKLSWDWQTSALVLAVCACIIFFLVAGCSAIIYVRQWRRMKRNFEPAGLEEISARLNLMVKAELAELISGAPMTPGDPETRCQYLEKLLDRKRETPTVVTDDNDNRWPDTGGNLYIEEGAKSTRYKRSQIAQIHQNIENIHAIIQRDCVNK